jgi:hypothetical protein
MQGKSFRCGRMADFGDGSAVVGFDDDRLSVMQKTKQQSRDLGPSTSPLVLSHRKPQPLSSETNGWEKRQDASGGLPTV